MFAGDSVLKVVVAPAFVEVFGDRHGKDVVALCLMANYKVEFSDANAKVGSKGKPMSWSQIARRVAGEYEVL